MEHLEYTWNQLYLGIIINAIIALIITITFKFIIIPKIERKYERNEFNAYVGVMGFVNSFDDGFKSFYILFEHYVGNIRDLNKDEWLPSLHQECVEIDGGDEPKMKPKAECDSALKTIEKFDKLNQDLFIKHEEGLRNHQKTLFEYIEKNENYIDPELRSHICRYITWTIFYVERLRHRCNCPEQLFERFERAKKIIQLLKKEQSFGNKFTRFWKREKFEDIQEIGKFVKKWQDYEESEKI